MFAALFPGTSLGSKQPWTLRSSLRRSIHVGSVLSHAFELLSSSAGTSASKVGSP